MTRALVRFYTIVRTECEITLPNGVDADEAQYHLREECNHSDPKGHHCLPAIYKTMNNAADALGGWVDWADTEGIEITEIPED